MKSFSRIFEPRSSFLNRLMIFLLYKCGAFSISLMNLETAVREHGVPATNVLCRHGADPLSNLGAMFIDFNRVKKRLTEMQELQAQEPRPLWRPGTFRTPL
jgi:hypothetical protein